MINYKFLKYASPDSVRKRGIEILIMSLRNSLTRHNLPLILYWKKKEIRILKVLHQTLIKHTRVRNTIKDTCMSPRWTGILEGHTPTLYPSIIRYTRHSFGSRIFSVYSHGPRLMVPPLSFLPNKDGVLPKNPLSRQYFLDLSTRLFWTHSSVLSGFIPPVSWDSSPHHSPSHS